jgi:hypothetical protein
MFIKNTIIFHCKTVQTLPKLRFLVWKYENIPSGNPDSAVVCRRTGSLIQDLLKGLCGELAFLPRYALAQTLRTHLNLKLGPLKTSRS